MRFDRSKAPSMLIVDIFFATHTCQPHHIKSELRRTERAFQICWPDRLLKNPRSQKTLVNHFSITLRRSVEQAVSILGPDRLCKNPRSQKMSNSEFFFFSSNGWRVRTPVIFVTKPAGPLYTVSPFQLKSY